MQFLVLERETAQLQDFGEVLVNYSFLAKGLLLAATVGTIITEENCLHIILPFR